MPRFRGRWRLDLWSVLIGAALMYFSKLFFPGLTQMLDTLFGYGS